VSDERPPPALDAAIIAAAHKSTQGGNEQAQVNRARPPYRSWLTRWQPLAAAAAVAGLAFVLVQSLPRERDVAPSIRMEQPAQVPAASQETLRSPSSRTAADETTAAEPPAQAGAQEAVTATASAWAKAAVRAPGMTVPSPVAPQAPASTAAATSERDNAAAADGTHSVRAMDAEQRNAATSKMATGVASAEVAAAAVQESRQVGAAPLSAADRAEEIAALYAAGDVAGAADVLRAFRAGTPDADTYLPESLRDWARTVE
jgi:cytoskeletal protein RodZ